MSRKLERTRNSRLRKPPKASLRRLEGAASSDYEVALLVLRLCDAILGTESSLACARWRTHDADRFPAKLSKAAHAVTAWASYRGIVVNEIVRVRQVVLATIAAVRRSSPFGIRRLKIAEELRSQHPPHTPQPGCDFDRYYELPILDDLVGQPIGPGLIRRVSALRPAQIEIWLMNEPRFLTRTPHVVYVYLCDDGYTVDRICFAGTVPTAVTSSVVEGFLEGYFETGTEGVVWSVVDPNELGYDGLNIINEGDHLEIQDALGRRIWAGKIECDTKSGWRKYPLNPEYGQPCALGRWVHWTQRGFTPDDWARFFIREDRDRFRAILTKTTAEETKP